MLKVGLIGCGFMGAMHANCYKNIDGVKLVALADIRREKAEALADADTKIYSDGMELIENADVDIIDICLPTYLHTKYALAAMDKVKYLFIEKPVSLTLDESELLLEKSAKLGVQVQVGQVVRFMAPYRCLAQILTEKKYGKVINANFRRISPRPNWGWEDWLLDDTRSGGANQDLYIHDIDYILSVFGESNELYSVRNTLGEKKSYGNTLMKYDDFVVSVEGTWGLPTTFPFSATYRIVFENATVESAGGKIMEYTDAGVNEIVVKDEIEVSGSVEGGNISSLGGYIDELVYFTDCAKAGKPVEKASLKDGVASLKFLLTKVAAKQ